MLFEVQFNCVHPLCRRWPQNKKQVRRLVYVADSDDVVAVCVAQTKERRLRRCMECRRVVSQKHMTIKQINPTDGSYMEDAA